MPAGISKFEKSIFGRSRVDTGESKCSIYINQIAGKIYVIEMNPSIKVFSFSIKKLGCFSGAKVAAKLIDYTLDELRILESSFGGDDYVERYQGLL